MYLVSYIIKMKNDSTHYFKIIALIILMFITSFGYAQIYKGTKSFGLNSQLGFNGEKYATGDFNSFSIAVVPSYTWFKEDNRSIGLFLGTKYQYSKSNSKSWESLTYYVGGLVRRYFPFKDNSFGLTITNSLMYGKESNDLFSQDQSFWTFAIRPGFYAFLNERTALELSLGDIYFTFQNDISHYGINIFGLNTNLDLTFRFFVFAIPKKHLKDKK